MIKIITSALLLGLLGISGCNSSRKNATSASTFQPVANKNSATDKWTGQWEIKDPTSNNRFKFFLTPEGKLYVIFSEQAASGNPIAYELPVKKISDDATLPSNIKVISIEQAIQEQALIARQNEGKTIIGSLNRSQQAYFLEHNKFSSELEPLGLGIKPETENYIYKIVPQGDQTSSVMMIGQAKSSEFKSYVGLVYAVESNDEIFTTSGLCETDKPLSTLPAMPTAPKAMSEQVQCPAGFSPVVR